jgi:hypothetical protein
MTSIDTDITFVALHRRYTGNLKETVFKDMMQKKPTEVILLALPRFLSPFFFPDSAPRSLPQGRTQACHMCGPTLRSRVLSLCVLIISPPLLYHMI